MRDPAAEKLARQAIWDFLARGRFSKNRRRIHLVSYPRSGSTLVRQYLSILQGRAQHSIYAGDVVNANGEAVARELDKVEMIKSHQIPADDSPMIYLVRDGRNATLSFLYMAFLFGGHRFSALDEVCAGIRHLDSTEGCWADHVARAHQQSKRRATLFVRYEDVVAEPAHSLMQMARFAEAEISAEAAAACINRQRERDDYAKNPYNGYLYQPAKNSIYDVLKQNRRGDYWKLIFDGCSKQHFHECGGTRWLLHFGYEQETDWWAR